MAGETPSWCPSNCPGRIGRRRQICRLYQEKTKGFTTGSDLYKIERQRLDQEANKLRNQGEEGIEELKRWCVMYYSPL